MGRGLSIHTNQDDIIYALANLEIAISSNINNTFAIGYSGELGLNKNLNEKSRLLVTYKNQWFPDEKYNSKTLYLGINYYLSPVVNIGFELDFDETSIKTEGISSIRLNYLF